MGIRINWTDTNTVEDGYNVYRHTASMLGLTDAQLATYLLDELPADATDYEDGTAVDGTTYFYIIATKQGGSLIPGQEVEITASAVPDYSSAQVGDAIGGGIYAGVDTIGGTDYHIIAGDAASEQYGLKWKISRSATPGATSDADGLANTLAMEGTGYHPAADYCFAYEGGGFTDWHMPARNQITLMYNNLAGHPGFATNVSSGDYTWTSTEGLVGEAAYTRRFSDGDENGYKYKDATIHRTRPIRRVPV